MFSTIKKALTPATASIEGPLLMTQSLGAAQAAAQATLKGAQLLRGRTQKTRETRIAELAEAREHCARTQQALGEILDSGGDLSVASQAMAEAESRVKQLEAGLTVAQAKDDVALAELKQAERMVKEEEVVAIVAELKYDICQEFQQWLQQGRTLIVQRLWPKLNAARVYFPDPKDAVWIGDLGALDTHIAIGLREVIPRGRALFTMLGGRSYTELCLDPQSIRTKRKS